MRWIAVGGGPSPDSNEVSIEQDLLLAQGVLGAGGHLLFAGGAGTQAVQIRDREDDPDRDPLVDQLAFLFAPRSGRDARYRPTVLDPAGPALAPAALQAVIDGAAQRGPPLLVLFSGHGDQGPSPSENLIALWGHTALTPIDLAAGLDTVAAPRRVRVVVSTCHSGGFEDLLFIGGTPEGGVSPQDRCGLFSTTWDRQASGCSPAPQRHLHEGFTRLFFQALQGRDEADRPLPLEVLDLDGDGIVGLLEAHARVRIVSTSIDVPTTTSERWARELAPPELSPEADVSLPVELAVIRALEARTGSTDPDATGGALDALADRLTRLDARLADAQAEEARWFDATAAELLSRWPVLDDPWHPDFRATLASQRSEIALALAGSAPYAHFAAASAAADRLDQEVGALEREEAPLLRLRRARDTVRQARRLAARGGRGWEVFRRLRACEAGAP